MSLKDPAFGPRARGLVADSVPPFSREEDALIREYEFPPFVTASMSTLHAEDGLEALAHELFRSGYQVWATVRGYCGEDCSLVAYERACWEGMRLGAEKYGVDWPFADNLTEVQAEARDVGVYAFLMVLRSMLERGGLDRYKGVHLVGSEGAAPEPVGAGA